MNCLTCKEEFKPKTKFHQFCSRKCAMKNYFSKEKVATNKLMAPPKNKMKTESKYFTWKDYPHTVII